MNIIRWIAVIVLPVFAACSWWMDGRPGGGDTDELSFNHQFHAVDMAMECTECHEGIDAAADLAASYTPPEDTCLMCHDREGDCELCHSNPENRPPRIQRTADITFSHVEHLERVEGDCTTCHSDVQESTAQPLAQITMDTCLACHNHDQEYANAQCIGCHPTLQRLPLPAVAEFDHRGDWMQWHGTMAMSNGGACLQCHTETSCNLCHSATPASEPVRLFPEQVERTLIHRGDWLTVHSIDARADSDSCVRCHNYSTFCMDCHTAAGVSGAASNPYIQHPPGWLTPGSAQFHGTEARRQIATCGSCHDQGATSNCVTCHQVGGVGGNPHPSGWSSRYESEDIQSNSMCQTCHISGS